VIPALLLIKIQVMKMQVIKIQVNLLRTAMHASKGTVYVEVCIQR